MRINSIFSVETYLKKLLEILPKFDQELFWNVLGKQRWFLEIIGSLKLPALCLLDDEKYWRFIGSNNWLSGFSGEVTFDELAAAFPTWYRDPGASMSAESFQVALGLFIWLKTAEQMGLVRLVKSKPKPVKDGKTLAEEAQCREIAARFNKVGLWRKVLDGKLPFASLDSLRQWVSEHQNTFGLPVDVVTAFITQKSVCFSQSGRIFWRHPCGFIFTDECYRSFRSLFIQDDPAAEAGSVADQYHRHGGNDTRWSDRFSEEYGFGWFIVTTLAEYYFGSLGKVPKTPPFSEASAVIETTLQISPNKI
ncbi:MAG: hypothetical protein WCV50_04070 [Patescibacteria group bacterium]|jgi:hypothetical protein